MLKARIAVFVSGGGTNLQALIDAEKSGIIQSGHICLVVSNKAEAYALERARQAGIPAVTLLRKDCGGQEGFEAALLQLLEQEKELAEQEKALMEAQKEKMRANLLRAVSHDLRTPLTGIIGNSSSYLEMEDRLSDDEKRELVECIKGDANWLLNMVENLLSVTRIDNDTASVSKSLEPVDEVVAAAVIQFKKRFPEAEVHVIVPEQEPDDALMVMMDAMLIQQVILNILQNAQLHSESKKPLELTVDEDDNNVYVHIRDFGVGIDESRLETIFDGGGFKGDKDNVDGYKGMGIGLSICKTIILAHNGQIVAKNQEEGAEFCFSLPKETED